MTAGDGPIRQVRVLRIARRTVEAWFDDDAIRWSAALAYYSVISLAPLVVLAVTVVSQLMDGPSAERWVLQQVADLAGPQAREVAGSVLSQMPTLDLASVGAVLTILLLLFGATAVFVTLQRALNRVWAVAPKEGAVRNLVRSRLAAFLAVLALGGVMVLSVFVGAVIGWVGAHVPMLDGVVPWLTVADLLSSLLFFWVGVSAVFWVLPDVEITWRDVWIGALVTAVLLMAGKAGLSIFLAQRAAVSLYGAAGSIFLLLLWVYYSALVFFLGAEFTQVWAEERGRTIQPARNAAWARIVQE